MTARTTAAGNRDHSHPAGDAGRRCHGASLNNWGMDIACHQFQAIHQAWRWPVKNIGRCDKQGAAADGRNGGPLHPVRFDLFKNRSPGHGRNHHYLRCQRNDLFSGKPRIRVGTGCRVGSPGQRNQFADKRVRSDRYDGRNSNLNEHSRFTLRCGNDLLDPGDTPAHIVDDGLGCAAGPQQITDGLDALHGGFQVYRVHRENGYAQGLEPLHNGQRITVLDADAQIRLQGHNTLGIQMHI